MLGAEIMLVPHVTGCLPSPMPGRGRVDPKIWRQRELDPVRCRQEFDGPKGRAWLLRWLSARAYENGVYAVYTNPIGMEGGTIKPGGSLVLRSVRRNSGGVPRAGGRGSRRHARSRQARVGFRAVLHSGQAAGAVREDDRTQPRIGSAGNPEVWWKKHRSAECAD